MLWPEEEYDLLRVSPVVAELVRINSQVHEPKALVIQSICTKDKLFLDDKHRVHSPISTVTALERHS